jgi:hypothetical protein
MVKFVIPPSEASKTISVVCRENCRLIDYVHECNISQDTIFNINELEPMIRKDQKRWNNTEVKCGHGFRAATRHMTPAVVRIGVISCGSIGNMMEVSVKLDFFCLLSCNILFTELFILSDVSLVTCWSRENL